MRADPYMNCCDAGAAEAAGAMQPAFGCTVREALLVHCDLIALCEPAPEAAGALARAVHAARRARERAAANAAR